MIRATLTLTHRNQQRRAALVVPSNYRPGTPLPLVLGFHGGVGGGATFERQTRFSDEAERRGFAVCYPEGTPFWGTTTWNAGHCCGYAVWRGVDDVGFAVALVEKLARDYSIDLKRVYAAGFSNGAMLCYRLACEAPKTFAAVAVVSGSMDPRLVPNSPMPLIAFHGLADRNVPYGGGQGSAALQPVSHQAFESTLATWVVRNSCPTRTGMDLGNGAGSRRLWSNQKGTQIEAYTLTDGGHTWPGGVNVGAMLGTGKLVAGVNATGLIAEFFASRARP